ncbi:MAG: adenosylcobinamide-GDP ribazoletransferase [Gemmatimonadales bacterium]|nr:MAG: adenosylcobinamide-GDP ribazoletransferase [Gemmatimonadales bacterium]
MKGLAAAIRFLTIIPVPSGSAGRLTMTPWFPVAGVVVGLPVLATLALSGLIPRSEGGGIPLVFLPAVGALLVWTAITGGLHEDGWADCADAALAPVDQDRRREILKDPRVGVHGATALILLLLVRFSALASFAALPPGARELGLILVPPMVGRTAMVISLRAAEPLTAGGLGTALAAGARPGLASVLTLVMVTGTVMWVGPHWLGPAALAVAGAAFVGLGIALFLSRRFGGLSGDGHGATGIGTETATLVGLALALGGAAP